MKQKFLASILVLCLILSVCAPASAAAAPKRVYTFSLTPGDAQPMEEASEGVTWTLNDGLLTISGTGAMDNYAEGEAPWLGAEVYSLVIADGVTEIGSNAFRGMELLQDAVIGRGVTSIANTAFNDCSYLSNVVLLGDDHTIPGGTFANCTNLSTFRFAGDQPTLESEALVTGYRDPIYDSDTVSLFYDGTNETWADKKDIQFDPVEPIEYRPYDNYIAESGICGDDLSWQIVCTNDSLYAHYVVITGTGPMYDYAEGEAPWLDYIKENRLTVKGLYILPGCSSIGENAFVGMKLGLSSIPGSVREIGAGAFRDNKDLSYTPKNSVRSVGDYALANTGVVHLTLESTQTEFGEGVYSGCESVVKAKLPEGMTTIPDRMFADCNKLREVTIPTSMTSIGTEAFSGCKRLKTVNYYGTTQQWDAIEVAEGNEALLNAELEGVLTTSGTCGEAATWELSEDFTTLTISGTGDVTSRPWINASGLVETIIVGEGITSLCDYAFHDFVVATDIQLPETLTAIGAWCFYHCDALVHVELPAGLTGLGKGAFSGCDVLESIVIPEGITEIPEDLLSWCKKLVSVEMSEKVTGIGASAFALCESLSEINVPNTITKLGGDAFLSCKSLTSFEWPEAIRTVGTALRLSGITELVLPETVERIGERAFDGCSKLESITIPHTVNAIGKYAFQDTPSLTEINIPNGIMTIPEGCFARSGITEAIIPDSVYTIERYAFKSCENLERVVLPESLNSIASEVFTNCSSLSEINWPSGVTEIGWHQFKGTALTEFTVPATVEEIGSYAFMDCTQLETLTFESKYTDVTGSQIFENCPLLTIYCYYDSPAQAAAEFNLIPYVLFDAPDDLPRYQVLSTVYGDGTVVATPAESTGFEWVTVDFVPGPDSVFVIAELYCIAYEKPNVRIEKVDEDTVRMLMPKCPVEFVALFVNQYTGFCDIKPTDFFYEPVIWAFQNGITDGISEIEFGPNAECNRAQVVTFLWRAAGCPEPTTTENPFADVSESIWYYKPVLWAVENGITNGLSATEFGPNAICNRAQVVTFLHRAFGSPAPESDVNPFTDVPAEAWYAAPVLWAVENGITNGISATEFGPNVSCNRAQVVTFLYRAYAD